MYDYRVSVPPPAPSHSPARLACVFGAGSGRSGSQRFLSGFLLSSSRDGCAEKGGQGRGCGSGGSREGGDGDGPVEEGHGGVCSQCDDDPSAEGCDVGRPQAQPLDITGRIGSTAGWRVRSPCRDKGAPRSLTALVVGGGTPKKATLACCKFSGYRPSRPVSLRPAPSNSSTPSLPASSRRHPRHPARRCFPLFAADTCTPSHGRLPPCGAPRKRAWSAPRGPR